MKNSLTTLLFLFVSGCALAPGMYMNDAPISGDVKITPITPDLIVQQEMILKRQTDAEKIPSSAIRKNSYQYRIGQHDILNITVWDHPELTIPAGEFRSVEAAGHLVAEDGTIFYPYAGQVKVSGKTVAEVRNILTDRISRTIAKPQLDVRVAAFRSQKSYIVGEVKNPGPQPITDVPLTVVEAVNLAGGVTGEADMANVTVNRDGKILKINLLAMYEQGDTSQDVVLEDDDILHIPDRNTQKVFVLGEVARPSSYLIHRGRMSLAEAIGDAGGVDRITANAARVFVIRSTTEDAEIFHLDSSSPEALILGDRFLLEPRDVVYVDTAGITRWNRVIQQLLPTTQLMQNLSIIESRNSNGTGN